MSYECTGIYTAETFADCRTIGNHATNRVCFCKGYSAVNDGFGGMFYWDNDSVSDDNDVTILRPSDTDASDPGRWHKEF